MKQLLQNLKDGRVELADVPCPMVRPGCLLIQTRASLISAGTERMLVEFGQGGLIAKARSKPEKVKQVLDKIKTEGLLPTLEAVFARLDEPMPLGYCNAGVVIGVGAGVTAFDVGDRVISNGPHAEVVCVPVNLCAKVSQGVSDDAAAFTVLSAIAMQGIRLTTPTLGERVVVTGLGLIGLIAVQLLRANGCTVLGIDFDTRKLELARSFGAETVDLSAGADPVATAAAFSDGAGVDAVLVTASSKSNDIMHEAAQMSRKRGRVVLVGVVGLELRRSDFYQKELSFQVSCSYGPGRYDAEYEERGRDYPLPFVRWTEQRNFEAVLEMMASGRLNVATLTDKRVPLADAPGIYQTLPTDRDTLGIVLRYPPELHSIEQLDYTIKRTDQSRDRKGAVISQIGGPPETEGRPLPHGRGSDTSRGSDPVVIGAIGAGNFAKMSLMPVLVKTPAVLRTIASRGGVSAAHLGRKFGFAQTTTDYHAVLSDPQVNAVIITTRHNTHASMTIEALSAGKHVFVEKPLALNADELHRVRAAYGAARNLQLMVGFNRRFSLHIDKVRQLVGGRAEPLCMVMTINAGFAAPDSWVHDPAVGGGRIIGEGCHWIDLMSFIAGSPVTAVQATMVGAWPGAGTPEDKMTIDLSMADGSIGTLHYFANGDKSFPKERLEVFWQKAVLQLDNFRRLVGFGVRGFRKFRTSRVDKGHRAEIEAFVDRVAKGGPPLIPFEQLENATRASFAAVESARTGKRIEIAGQA